MFTKISKVILWIGIIGCVILSIISGVTNHSFWIVLGGLLGTTIAFSGFGMLIEISENIAESRDYLSGINQKLGSGGAVSTGLSSYSGMDQNYTRTADKLGAIANGDTFIAEDFWYCKECGTKNEKLSPTCKGCGKYK